MIIAPVPENEKERLKSLKSYGIMDTLPEQDFDDITKLASEICQTPVSLITLLDDKRQWFKSAYGIVGVSETPKEQSFCSHAILDPEKVFVVEDATADERFADNPLVTGEPRVNFYGGVPLVNTEGFPLGTLCVIDNKPNKLSDKQVESLKALANQVVGQLELRKKILDLNRLTEDLHTSNKYLERFAVMASHDIKNPLTNILLTSGILQTRYEEQLDAKGSHLLKIINNSARKLLGFVDDMLAYSKSHDVLVKSKRKVNLSTLMQSIIQLTDIPGTFKIEYPDNAVLITSEVALQQILSNLINNSIRYNDKQRGLIRILFSEDEDFYFVSVYDNGVGIEPNNFEKIFDPMVTLQQTDRFNNKGTGVGLSTVRNLVLTLGGEVTVQSIPGQETTISFSLKKD